MTNENQEMVTVDRGDGHTFQMRRNELGAFSANNPGAFIVGDKVPPAPADEPPTEMDVSLELSDLTVAELKAKAEAEGIGLAGATRKDDIIAAIEAGSSEEAGEAPAQ